MLSTKVKQKSVGKMRSMHFLAVLLVPVAALIMGAAVPQVWAGGTEFEETEFNIEYNFTDQDLGVRAFVDGEPWRSVTIIDPNWKVILAVKAIKSLSKQGLAELFFESGEPTLAEVPIDVFLNRFPEGTYKFFGRDVERKFVHGDAEFTHDIPCAPENATYTPGNGNGTITWDPVENKINNDDGQCDVNDTDIEIDGYEVVVEGLDEEDEEVEFSIKLSGDATSVEVPEQVETVTKFEVLAIEESGNQTIREVVLVPEEE